MKALLKDQDAEPENYWAKTSGNAMVGILSGSRTGRPEERLSV